jgi:hypothetical protein
MLRARLTTVDNPHDPFDDYPAWFAFDTSSGYHTPSFLARILKDSDQLSDADEELAISQAIDEIVQENVLGIYKKVTRDIPEQVLEEATQEG